MFAFNSFPAICAILFVSIVILYFCYLEFFAFHLPKNLPSIGFRDEFFSRTRASYRQVFKSTEDVEEGYKKYGQKNRSYVVPHASFRPQVMLPQEHIKWLVAQPETVLNPEVVRIDRQGIDYFPLATDSKTNLLAAHKIIASFNKNLDVLQPALYDGIKYAVDKELGTDTNEWHEFPLMDTVSTFLDSAVSRVMFGVDLSRDDGYLRVLRGFILGGGILTELVGQLPFGLFRPLVAFPVALFTNASKKMSIKYLRPRIRECLQKIEDEKAGKVQDDEYDFMTQVIRSVKKLKFPTGISEEAFIEDILMFLALAAVVSTRTTTVNALLDMLGAGAKDDTYATLRKETESIIKTEADWIDPASLKDMIKIDSALRESARVNPLQTRGLLKQVMPREGIDLPDGTHVAQGTWLGVAVEAIHRDEAIYPNALQFDAFRFSRLKEEENKTNLDVAQPSDTYMFFSYGRSMCPGRWFATRVMKLIVAYLTIHYDIKPLTDHPERFSLGDTKLHHTAVKLVVRRRQVPEK